MNDILRGNIEAQIRMLESTVNSLQRTDKAGSDYRDRDQVSNINERLEILWNTLSTISEHVGIRVNQKTGGVERVSDPYSRQQKFNM